MFRTFELKIKFYETKTVKVYKFKSIENLFFAQNRSKFVLHVHFTLSNNAGANFNSNSKNTF